MNIERTERRNREEGCGQDHAVRCDHHGLGARITQPRRCFGRLQRLGLENLQAAADGKALYCAGGRLLPAASPAVRLGKYQRDVMPRRMQRRKSSLGEFRGAGENESQEGAVRPICAAVWRAGRECAAA